MYVKNTFTKNTLRQKLKDISTLVIKVLRFTNKDKSVKADTQVGKL